jgi:methyl-accepting chemotaxis protein
MSEFFTSYNVILSISVILNIIFLIGIRNLLKQNEQLEDDLVNHITGIRRIAENTLSNMEVIDSRGAFKSDDEVGAIFEDLKNMVEYLNNEISEYNVKSERKND